MMNACSCIRCGVLLCIYTIKKSSCILYEKIPWIWYLFCSPAVWWIQSQQLLCATPPSLSALQASGWHDAERSGALSGHEPRHLVQAESGDRLPIHLQNFIASAKQACVRALATAVSHLLYVHAWNSKKDVSDVSMCSIATIGRESLSKSHLCLVDLCL